MLWLSTLTSKYNTPLKIIRNKISIKFSRPGGTEKKRREKQKEIGRDKEAGYTVVNLQSNRKK